MQAIRLRETQSASNQGARLNNVLTKLLSTGISINKFILLLPQVVSSHNFIVILIYRSPSNSGGNFIEDFYNLIDHVFYLSILFFIIWDFNLHFKKPEDFYVSKCILY